jgi:membrane protease YdiL (CAAX protease family)
MLHPSSPEETMPPIMPNTPPASRFWRVVHLPPVLLLIAAAMFAAARQIIRFAGILPEIADIRSALAAAIFTVAVFTLVYWAFVRFVERRPVVDEFSTSGSVRELGAGLLLGLLSFSAVIGIIAAFRGYRVVGFNPVGVLLPILAISLKSGVIEEIISRGIIFRIVERSLGSWIAILSSSALFGAAHLGNPNATAWSAFAVAIEGGMISAALYMLTRRLWAAIGEHFSWNFTQGGIYGVPISGHATRGVLQPDIAGSVALSGGSFGAEASVPALIVSGALIVILLALARRHDRFVQPFWSRSTADL